MICIRFETCRGCCILVPPIYRAADVVNLVGLSRDAALELLCFTNTSSDAICVARAEWPHLKH